MYSAVWDAMCLATGCHVLLITLSVSPVLKSLQLAACMDKENISRVLEMEAGTVFF